MTRPRPLVVGEIVRRRGRPGVRGTVYGNGAAGGAVIIRWWRDSAGREISRFGDVRRRDVIPVRRREP